MIGKIVFAAAIAAAVAVGPPPIARIYAVDIDGKMLMQEAVPVNPEEGANPVEGVKLMTKLQDEGKMQWSYTLMGGKIIVKEIAGVAHELPKTTWSLTHIRPIFHGRPGHEHVPGDEQDPVLEHRRYSEAARLADEEVAGRGPQGKRRHVPPPMPGHIVNPNVNLADVYVRGGDILEWRMYRVGEQPLSMAELPPMPPTEVKREL